MNNEVNAQKIGYKAIKKELPERMKSVLDQMAALGDCTYSELANACGVNANLVTNRLSDLQKVGLIKRVGIKEYNGSKQSIFRVCSEVEAKEIQRSLYVEYRTKREDLETDYITLSDKTQTTKELIKTRIEYYKVKIDLLLRFAV